MLHFERESADHINNSGIRSLRFQNRLIQSFSKTVANIYGTGTTINQILFDSIDCNDARLNLIQNVCGFGPKQSSLYLRRIHYSDNFAVLDTHIIDYLKLNKLVSTSKSSLDFHSYLDIENIFLEHAKQSGYSAGCFDLATWITMRVAKREGYSCVL